TNHLSSKSHQAIDEKHPSKPMTAMAAESQSRLLEEWTERLRGLAGLGLAGYRALGIDRIAPAVLKSLIAAVREKADAQFLAWTPG
ncbi:hypothetical protein ACC685_37565, partial [Rhizobium ruizarguesonis]